MTDQAINVLVKIIAGVISAIIIGLFSFIIWLIKDKFQILGGLIKELKEDFKKLQDKVSKQGERIGYHNGMIGNKLSKGSSPRVLNELGLNLLNKSGLRELIDKNLEFLITELEGRKPKTALDVQNLCMSLFIFLQDKDFLTPIKNYVYSHPKFEGMDLNMDAIAHVGGLYLRDKYLKKHPELLEFKK